MNEIIDLANQLGVPIQYVARQELDKLAKGHQGSALEVGRYPTVHPQDILQRAATTKEPPFFVALDHIEDPNNLGAILRTAEIVGVHGAIIPKQRAVGITPAVVNASAGAAEHMWVAEVPNLVQTLKILQKQNIWVAGLENVSDAIPFHEANLGGALALVTGSEGSGLSRLVRETCDFLIKLPMRGYIESLNASVATALALYQIWQARDFAGAQS
jgi:23S rRNA (guanosine2251-2'-O)-methyltransferase